MMWRNHLKFSKQRLQINQDIHWMPVGWVFFLVWEARKQELAMDLLLPEEGECHRTTRDTDLFSVN